MYINTGVRLIQPTIAQSEDLIFLKVLGIISLTCFENVRYRNHIVPHNNPLMACFSLCIPVPSKLPLIMDRKLVKNISATYTFPQNTAFGFLLTKEYIVMIATSSSENPVIISTDARQKLPA